MYDIIVVGGGHAGCEAANASAKKGHKTLLMTSNLKNIADMPCNPHIGGSAKGIVVREIDALGGLMGKVADKTHLQIKMLNSAKGPAVQSLRAQGDKIAYPKEMLEQLGKLENGLEVFVLENHTVPLVYVEIAVKCGAFTQEEETSGLFHLYEHLMFKGNSKYKSAQEVNKALNDLGTASWNGTTGLECVNYYFTIPKDQLKEGLEFWSSAIRNPLLDKKELEREILILKKIKNTPQKYPRDKNKPKLNPIV